MAVFSDWTENAWHSCSWGDHIRSTSVSGGFFPFLRWVVGFFPVLCWVVGFFPVLRWVEGFFLMLFPVLRVWVVGFFPLLLVSGVVITSFIMIGFFPFLRWVVGFFPVLRWVEGFFLMLFPVLRVWVVGFF